MARINMYGVLAGECSMYFTNGERIAAPDANGQQRIDDYRLDSSGTAMTEWIDAWFIRNDGDGVKEVYDLFPDGYYDVSAYPFDHGKIVAKGGAEPNVDSTAFGLLSLDGHYHQTRYRIWMQDIKTSVSIPAGTFSDVTMQAESQDFCDYDLGECPAVPNTATMRYRWYFAPGQGYIAMTSLDADWSPVNTMYLLRTCIGTPTEYVCP